VIRASSSYRALVFDAAGLSEPALVHREYQSGDDDEQATDTEHAERNLVVGRAVRPAAQSPPWSSQNVSAMCHIGTQLLNGSGSVRVRECGMMFSQIADDVIGAKNQSLCR
jgi:hypothetical protein